MLRHGQSRHGTALYCIVLHCSTKCVVIKIKNKNKSTLRQLRNANITWLARHISLHGFHKVPYLPPDGSCKPCKPERQVLYNTLTRSAIQLQVSTTPVAQLLNSSPVESRPCYRFCYTTAAHYARKWICSVPGPWNDGSSAMQINSPYPSIHPSMHAKPMRSALAQNEGKV